MSKPSAGCVLATEIKEFRNIDYKSDTDYVTCIARTLLTPIGIWPLYRGESLADRIKMYLQTGFVFFLICIFLIPCVIHTFFDAEDLLKMMKAIASEVYTVLAAIKFCTIVINRKEIRYCLEEMENQYKKVLCEDDRMVMTNSARIGRIFTVAYLSLSCGGGLPYHIIMPLLAERIVKEDNTTQIPLPYMSNYIFFTVETSPMYEMFFVGQILISGLIMSTNCGTYTLIATCVMHACCLFEVACSQMERVLDNLKEDNWRKKIGFVIEQHVMAIRYAEMLEKALNIVFLCEMGGCTIIICFLEYGVLQDWEDREHLNVGTYATIIAAILVNVFILSLIGDRLKAESKRVGESTYSIQWYGLPTEMTKDLIMLMIKSSHPCTITAGKIFDVSLQGFSEVCKTSAAYFNFIRTMAA